MTVTFNFIRWRRAQRTLTVLAMLSCIPTTALAFDTEALQQRLQTTDRAIADRMRDDARRPTEVLEFLGRRTGMTALDVYAADGYFTLIMAWAVGDSGQIYAQNSAAALRYADDPLTSPQPDSLTLKIDNHALTNVVRLDRAITQTGLDDESVDFVLVSQILHDYYNRSPARALAMLHELHRILRPGGIVGIIDHTGLPGNDNARLHRMEKTQAIEVLERAGFLIEAESQLLANPADNPRRSTFDPALNRRTDQFLLRARKPESTDTFSPPDNQIPR